MKKLNSERKSPLTKADKKTSPGDGFVFGALFSTFLQRLFRIHGIPPFRLVLEPFGEPSVDGFIPFSTLLIVQYLVVLSYYLYEGRRFA